MDTVKVYGAGWCEDTKSTRAHLDAMGVAYQYIDVDRDDDARQWVIEHSEGERVMPAVAVGERVLVEPNKTQLDELLRAAAEG
jgi:glutaredoxin